MDDCARSGVLDSAIFSRVVIEPKTRAADPEILMESLFRLTELESKIPLNLNVLVKGRIPKVLGSRNVCANGSTICATCCCGARNIARRRSSIVWKCLAAI